MLPRSPEDIKRFNVDKILKEYRDKTNEITKLSEERLLIQKRLANARNGIY